MNDRRKKEKSVNEKKKMDKKKKPDTVTPILIKALLNIKSLTGHLGDDLLSPEVLKWFKGWDGKAFEKVKEIEVEVIGEKIILKDGKATGNGKTHSLKTAIKIDNLLIVIHGGSKGKGQGLTFFPKKDGDRIVIFLDYADVKDELQMKMVLFHELVHVKQLRDKNSGFIDIRDSAKGKDDKKKTDKEIIDEIKEKIADNFEAEAHLATLFFAALLFQAHPEGEKSIIEKYKTALKKLNKHQKDATDQFKLFNQILKTLEKLVADIESENAKLKKQIEVSKTLRDKLKTELERYKKSLPKMKESDKIKKRLNNLEKKVDKAAKAIIDFEKLKLEIINKVSELKKKQKDIAKKTAERNKKKDDIKKEKDKAKKAKLTEELKEINKVLKKLKDSAKKDINKLNRVLKKGCNEAGKAQSEIKEIIDKLGKELGKSEDDSLIDLFTQLMAAFRKSANVLKKLKFKLDLLMELEKVLEKILD